MPGEIFLLSKPHFWRICFGGDSKWKAYGIEIELWCTWPPYTKPLICNLSWRPGLWGHCGWYSHWGMQIQTEAFSYMGTSKSCKLNNLTLFTARRSWVFSGCSWAQSLQLFSERLLHRRPGGHRKSPERLSLRRHEAAWGKTNIGLFRTKKYTHNILYPILDDDKHLLCWDTSRCGPGWLCLTALVHCEINNPFGLLVWKELLVWIRKQPAKFGRLTPEKLFTGKWSFTAAHELESGTGPLSVT